jgi:DNA ligase (NAD+)
VALLQPVDVGGVTVSRATSSVSGNADYLVIGDDPGQKRDDAAEQQKVEILDEAAFQRLLDGS